MVACGPDSLLPVRSAFHQAVRDDKAGYKLFGSLAVLSAKKKLYALAMQCYRKACEYRRKAALSWSPSPLVVDSSSVPEWPEDNPLPIAGHAGNAVVSPPVKARDILISFSDGKTALSYALIVHVKQPVPGKRSSFTHINNVGHMFITLIKFNSDNSVVSRSFGFYPHKTNLFSATPLHVQAAPVFKDDALHDWDEVVGKFISAERFSRILGIIERYARTTYNLNRNNCTDFGLSVAATGGISIAETMGSWPLGKGNNPGNAGESMLEGKFHNTDMDETEPLFVSSTIRSYTNQ